MTTEQGPNVTDPDARAILAAASATTGALDYMLAAVRDGETPNTEEIVQCLSDALNLILDRYPHVDAIDLHRAAIAFLGTGE